MLTQRPRILYLASSWPLGPVFGGQLRALHVGRALQAVGDVSLVVVSMESATPQTVRQTAEHFRLLPSVTPAVTPTGGLGRKLQRAFSVRYLDIHGCAASATDRQRLVASFGDYDLIWVLNSRTANLLNIWSWPHAHLDIDDIPSTYYRAMADSAKTRSVRWRARLQQYFLKRREMRFRRRFTTLSVCSRADYDYLGGGSHLHIIPNGFEIPTVVPSAKPDPTQLRIGFIGLYSYPPNLEGVRWFLREVWPMVRKAVPQATFRLVGKDTDGALAPHDPGVETLGWCADPSEEIATWSAMVVPIQFGGGTRIKIADAFSRKCPVVSTRLGAYGYEVNDRQELRLADRPEEFAQACTDLLRHPEQGKVMAERAWRLFLERWTWDAIAPKVQAAADDALRRSA